MYPAPLSVLLPHNFQALGGIVPQGNGSGGEGGGATERCGPAYSRAPGRSGRRRLSLGRRRLSLGSRRGAVRFRRCHGNRNARRRQQLLVPGREQRRRRVPGEQGMLVRTFPTDSPGVRVRGSLYCVYVLVQDKEAEIRRSVPPFVVTVPECNRVEMLLSRAEQMVAAHTLHRHTPSRAEAGVNEVLRFF